MEGSVVVAATRPSNWTLATGTGPGERHVFVVDSGDQARRFAVVRGR